jgi:glucose/arabinose dehydrogenase
LHGRRKPIGREIEMVRGKIGALVLSSLVVTGAAARAEPRIDLQLVVDGLAQPLFVTHAGDDSGRLFVVEQGGRILIFEDGALLEQPFLDLGDRVRSGGERGLLGLAFHPDFDANGRFFVDYTRAPDAATVIAEFHASAASPNRADPDQRVLLTVDQPFANHNGGMLAFGPDGDLCIGLGDGGGAGDPGNRAQNPDALLGKILRIDVDGARPYAIPEDNPFARGGGRPEIYALGLRNPWRFSFDRKDGRLLVGDVGQDRIEEVDTVRRGGNYGWPLMEGRSCYRPANGCERPGLTLPIAQYEHDRGRCSITGGYVYRGSAIPQLVGTYLFGDYCSGEIFALRQGVQSVLLETSLQVASFGEDAAGELYVVDHGGAVYRIVGTDQ